MKSVAAGDNHVCTVEPNSSVLCYGNGQQYQLGQNMQVNAAPPGVTAIGVNNAAEFFGRGNQSCALLGMGRRSAGGSTRARASVSAVTRIPCRRRRP